MEALGLLVWICCVVGCGYLANKKHRSVGSWLALGFFFGIFALIVLALLSTLPKVLVLPKKED